MSLVLPSPAFRERCHRGLARCLVAVRACDPDDSPFSPELLRSGAALASDGWNLTNSETHLTQEGPFPESQRSAGAGVRREDSRYDTV